MTENKYSQKEKYQAAINYENILGMHISSIARYRDENPKRYISSIETFILMCPKEIRSKGFNKLTELGLRRCEYENITNKKKILFDDLWQFINELLEEKNLIFKTSYIKTFS